MIPRIALVAGVLGIAALALCHPARAPFVQPVAALTAQPPTAAAHFERSHHLAAGRASNDDAVVYVAGAVARPGLYHLHAGDRNARAVALAGGLGASADAAGVNLAAHAQDGDEIYVPRAGESRRASTLPRGARRHSSRTPPPSGSVDVNDAAASELARVPGIGRAVAARIVELRQMQGPFTSLDELLDVAGMTQSRLERARAYLRQP
ncbi:MAG: ComEA family DNA-binding protein [Candidatus Eremiobacteraeota bacterium]|nr:ComEA family DNA-binding protein [Candidatus Eremiobacteraeota bacterium]